jgi:transcriptional regulator with XRE-family HTH domain
MKNRLIEERKRLGLNQDKMAEKGGVAKRTYCDYESGVSEPKASFFSAIAAEGVDVQYILTGTRKRVDIDSQRLQLAIETVEEGLQSTQRTIIADKKAQLIMAVYDLFEEQTPAAKQTILKLVKSAA